MSPGAHAGRRGTEVGAWSGPVASSSSGATRGAPISTAAAAGRDAARGRSRPESRAARHRGRAPRDVHLAAAQSRPPPPRAPGASSDIAAGTAARRYCCCCDGGGCAYCCCCCWYCCCACWYCCCDCWYAATFAAAIVAVCASAASCALSICLIFERRWRSPRPLFRSSCCRSSDARPPLGSGAVQRGDRGAPPAKWPLGADERRQASASTAASCATYDLRRKPWSGAPHIRCRRRASTLRGGSAACPRVPRTTTRRASGRVAAAALEAERGRLRATAAAGPVVWVCAAMRAARSSWICEGAQKAQDDYQGLWRVSTPKVSHEEAKKTLRVILAAVTPINPPPIHGRADHGVPGEDGGPAPSIYRRWSGRTSPRIGGGPRQAHFGCILGHDEAAARRLGAQVFLRVL